MAEYYTVDLRQANPNSRVLRDVNSEMGLDEVRDSIGDHLDPPDPIYLTKVARQYRRWHRAPTI